MGMKDLTTLYHELQIRRLYARYASPATALAHLEKTRWNGKVVCPRCGGQTVFRQKEGPGTRGRWQCWKCKSSFSPTSGTVMHNSHMDLRAWFCVIAVVQTPTLMTSNGLAKMLKVRQPTVWSMMRRVKTALKGDQRELLKRLVR